MQKDERIHNKEEEKEKEYTQEDEEEFPRPKDKNIVGTKWIFKKKFNKDGHVIRNKEILVCKGYAQVEGIQV